MRHRDFLPFLLRGWREWNPLVSLQADREGDLFLTGKHTADHRQIRELSLVLFRARYKPRTHLFLVHSMQGVLGQGLSIGYRKVHSAYHFDDAITSDVINKTEMSIRVTMQNAQCSWVWITFIFYLLSWIHYIQLSNCSVERLTLQQFENVFAFLCFTVKTRCFTDKPRWPS